MPTGTAVMRYTRSPHTTGEAEPRPGTSIFQRTFFVSLHSIGGCAVFETPVANGPRHCPQNRSDAASVCANVETIKPAAIAVARRIFFMNLLRKPFLFRLR